MRDWMPLVANTFGLKIYFFGEVFVNWLFIGKCNNIELRNCKFRKAAEGFDYW